jgi:hypothetical protein
MSQLRTVVAEARQSRAWIALPPERQSSCIGRSFVPYRKKSPQRPEEARRPAKEFKDIQSEMCGKRVEQVFKLAFFG